jgi:hypothetical protein
MLISIIAQEATPIPPERSKNPHSFSTVAEETILRTTAIEGIKYLAADGSEAAIESLFDFLGQSDTIWSQSILGRQEVWRLKELLKYYAERIM